MLAFAIIVGLLLQIPGWVWLIIGALAVMMVIQVHRAAQRQKSAYAAALRDFRWSHNLSPVEFERRCADYLSLHGWRAKTTVGSGDQGVDVLAHKQGVSLVIQCKLYNKPVGNKAVQEALAGQAFARSRYAAVVSNTTYTPKAQELAKRTGVRLLHFTDLARADALFGVSNRYALHGCPKCRVQLRLAAGRKGWVRCPECNVRFRAVT